MEEKALECQIAVMLRLIGVQPNVRGWRYIVDGVKLVAADEELAHHMTKELYPAIAAKTRHDQDKGRTLHPARDRMGLHERQSGHAQALSGEHCSL